MSPAVSSAPRNSTKIAIRQFHHDDLPHLIQLLKEGMLNYPAQQSNPRLQEYINNSLKTDLSDIVGTYLTPGGNFWVATSHDDTTHVVGMVGLELKPRHEGELRRTSVKSNTTSVGS
ncbi:hypothetical protein PC129_g12726 [Phytophthora cactorum]|uniref:Acyl-CoA N-acyltransferase n=1 Tax=Phytophthora cactorum TaxID=29920 RepID=A0A329SAR5_9STRA|nr:hypothetical protein Pcac1_g23840 [Phytophthora cactorum]KAG2839135.1 hypothetical protein PC111_g3985 [Phytophthora cactorum]KAG2848481.1 hypothetical protein PC112_g705 [Phytophthora cactorum]KAG2868634.1 hypothetical protein PC113_g892 [Phytophthora cactorum]KAG2894816.1 hypothetical protein PC114_g15736 [Phytophthora cactorum]